MNVLENVLRTMEKIMDLDEELMRPIIISYGMGFTMGLTGRYVGSPNPGPITANDPTIEETINRNMAFIGLAIPIIGPVMDLVLGTSFISLRMPVHRGCPMVLPGDNTDDYKEPGRTACFLAYAAGVATINADRLYLAVASIADKL